MPRAKAASRLEQLRKEAADLAARIKELETREKAQSRKDASRRQSLTGGIVIAYVDANPDSPFTKMLHDVLDKNAKPADRTLLGLPAK